MIKILKVVGLGLIAVAGAVVQAVCLDNIKCDVKEILPKKNADLDVKPVSVEVIEEA